MREVLAPDLIEGPGSIRGAGGMAGRGLETCSLESTAVMLWMPGRNTRMAPSSPETGEVGGFGKSCVSWLCLYGLTVSTTQSGGLGRTKRGRWSLSYRLIRKGDLTSLRPVTKKGTKLRPPSTSPTNKGSKKALLRHFHSLWQVEPGPTLLSKKNPYRYPPRNDSTIIHCDYENKNELWVDTEFPTAHQNIDFL